MPVIEKVTEALDNAGENPREFGEKWKKRMWGAVAIGATTIGASFAVNLVVDSFADSPSQAFQNTSVNPLRQPVRFVKWVGAKFDIRHEDGGVTVLKTENTDGRTQTDGVDPNATPATTGEILDVTCGEPYTDYTVVAGDTSHKILIEHSPALQSLTAGMTPDQVDVAMQPYSYGSAFLGANPQLEGNPALIIPGQELALPTCD